MDYKKYFQQIWYMGGIRRCVVPATDMALCKLMLYKIVDILKRVSTGTELQELPRNMTLTT